MTSVTDYTQLANALALTNTVILSNLSSATAALVYLEDEVRTLDSNVSTILDIVANTTFILNYTSFECECSGLLVPEDGWMLRTACSTRGWMYA